MATNSQPETERSDRGATGWEQAARSPKATIFSVGCPLAAFLMPLKLSLAYAVLAPLIVLWLVSAVTASHRAALTSQERRVLVPVAFFLVTCALSLCVGVSFRNGLPSLISLAFFAGTIVVFLRHAPLAQTASAVLAGQSISAVHSVLESAFPAAVPELFQGKVTEAGQLAVTTVMAIGLMWHYAQQDRSRMHARSCIAAGCVLAVALTSLGFHQQLALQPAALAALIGFTALLFLWLIRRSLRSSGAAQRVALLASVQAPLLVSALLLNLKRGPWLGVLAGCAVFFAFYARRVLGALLGASAFAVVALAPVRERIAASYEHFTIPGGRSTMWRMALDLASEYPLGIGYHNSGIIRQLAPEIPQELKHFHNNALNILAEMGWIGLALFAWFIVALLRCSFAHRRDILAVSAGCAFISWQAAGLVEYNIGDSEVLIIVWMLVGSLLCSIRERQRPVVAGAA